jgi:hypothetical protein
LALGGEIERTLRTLISAAEGSLPSTTTRGVRTVNAAPLNYTTPDQIYDSEVLTKDTFEELQSVSSFLATQVSRYTPSKDAQRLANNASTNLQVIIELMIADIKAGALRENSLPQLEDSNSAVTQSPSEREALIREFIRRIELSASIVKQNGLKGWRLDRAIDEAQGACTEAIAERKQALAALKNAAWTNLAYGGMFLLAAVVSSLLLMVVRDFMAAVIDTAANTREMADRLSATTIE